MAAADDAEEIRALGRMLIYARMEAERLELWHVLDQLRLIENLLAEQLANPLLTDAPGTGLRH